MNPTFVPDPEKNLLASGAANNRLLPVQSPQTPANENRKMREIFLRQPITPWKVRQIMYGPQPAFPWRILLGVVFVLPILALLVRLA